MLMNLGFLEIALNGKWQWQNSKLKSSIGSRTNQSTASLEQDTVIILRVRSSYDLILIGAT